MVRRALFNKKTIDYRLVSFLYWQGFCHNRWSGCYSPWRPSREDVANYREIFSSIPNIGDSRILILGATPEIRDLVASLQLKLKPVMIDFSLPMLIEMLQYAEKANADDEIWIKSDWLEAPLSKDFDVVIGDLVLRMIEASKQEEFLKKIRSILSSRGIFVTRLHFVDESLRETTAEEIISQLASVRDEKLAANEIVGKVFDKFSDTKSGVVCRKEAAEFLREAANKSKNARDKRIFSSALGAALYGMGWAANSRIQIEKLINEFFRVVDIKKSSDYLSSEFYPIYVLRSKSVPKS